ncbi:MAG TPA: hypothetical protein VNB23_15550, partial [Ramlibacter sp.]|nr:hypothetical protein [Ramlibacter sp.]
QAEALTSNDQVHTALQAGRYREVEAFYEKLRKDRTRQADGVFLFEKFYYAVYWYSSSDPNDASYWPKIDAATQAWVTHSPKSHLAAMTRAFALTYRGEVLQARGGSWAEVNRFASEARRLVDGSRGAGAGDVLWHATRLRVAGLQGVPRAEVVAMIEAAAQVDPYPMRLWLEASVALSPSGENGEDLVWLMKFAAERTAGQEGTSMQARVLHAAFWRFHQFLASPFGSTSLRWRELHESFQDWKRRYPDGYRLDLHGAMACAARDRKVTANVLAQTGEPSADIWDRIGGKNYAARCRKWASGSAEAPTT